jgi:hypothetical protein
MTADDRIERAQAQGAAGRTGQSLGSLTEERGDPGSNRVDITDAATAPLQDADIEDTNDVSDTQTRIGVGTSPEAVEELGEVAAGADFGEGTAPKAPERIESKGSGIPPGSQGANKASDTQRPV